MGNYSGTHGTSQSRANYILKNGFKISSGRAGKGVYFWCDGPYAEKLAIAWWEFCNSRNKFKNDDEKECNILLANFGIQDEEFLDLERRDIKAGLAQMAVNRGIESDRDSQNALRAAFIRKLESELNVKFKVIELSVSLPGREFCSFYPLGLIGSPHCYLVFDANCINITKISILVE